MSWGRSRATACAVVLATALSAGVPAPAGAAAAPSAAATTLATACSQALVLAVPGAGEGSGATTGTVAMGKTLRPVADAIIAGAATQGRTVTTLTITSDTAGPGALRGTGGGATPATRAITRAAWRAWRAPAGTLATRARAALQQAHVSCPDQLVYLIGYSQGAEALHRMLVTRFDAELASRTVAVYLVGDPARARLSKATIVGQPAAPRRGQGITALLAREAPADLPTPQWMPPVRQLCTTGDVVCDPSAAYSFASARDRHRLYGQTMVPLLEAHGRWLGRRLAQWPVPLDQTLTARVGLVSAARLTASVSPGSGPALRWHALGGLPPGMHLLAQGLLSGTPTQPGTYDLHFTVRNTSRPDVARPMPGHATVTVAPDLSSRTSAGGRHTCAVRSDGTLWCWGANFYGQLGQGDRVGASSPRQVGTNTNWVSVAAGGMHTCAIRTTGALWCWGLNDKGQLGLGTRGDRERPVRVGTDSDWREVTAGWRYTCALRQDRSAWCWGDGAYGQLGNGHTDLRTAPTPVAGGGSWQSIQAGGWHVCGVRPSGAGLCWGRNLDGQLGDGTRLQRRTPTPVAGSQAFASLTPSWTHTCGLSVDGQVSCWGANDQAQLGSGDHHDSTTPRELAGGGTWSALSTGAGFGCALDGQGLLWCWGTGRYGELGSSLTSVSHPVRVGAAKAWAGLTLGWLHGCVTAATGGPQCWGNNETGELGNGGTAQSPSPTPAVLALGGTGSDTSRGLWEPALTAAVPATPVARSSSRRASSTAPFTVVSFNVLGSNHTAARADANEFAPARLRAEWSLDYLDGLGASIVGFQEIQQDQLSWFARAAGAEYDVWPGTKLGASGVQTSVAWKSSEWTLVGSDSVTIPFITQTRLMPLLHLENKASGQRIWVMNAHNAPQGRQAQRTVAVRRELTRLKPLVGTDPVLFIGDFNEKARVFCEAGKAGFVSPRGGSYSAGACHPPSGRLRVDWIFGTPDNGFSGYREARTVPVQRITDHAILSARVTLP